MKLFPKDGGIFLVIAGMLLLGFSVGSLIMSCLGFALNKFSGSEGLSDTAVTLTGASSLSEKDREGLDVFLSSNPFNISARKVDAPSKPEPEPEVTIPEKDDDELEGVTLRGTLPGVGGWFDTEGKLSLVLVGKNIDNYKLQSVSYNEAVFSKGDNRITKYIVYGEVSKTEKPQAPKPPVPEPTPQASAPAGSIVAAEPGTQEGQVPSELVSNMVQNPFDELKRIRIRPNEQAGGLEVQWIQNDSLLKRLGVRRGDIIRSVNGIPFTNMGDIANSINSLMHSDRFDVEVTRGGKNTALRYVVK